MDNYKSEAKASRAEKRKSMGLPAYAEGGAVAKKGGSPTSSKTATRTATKTSTVANPKDNITVTGGAGDGDTQVTIGGGKRKGGSP